MKPKAGYVYALENAGAAARVCIGTVSKPQGIKGEVRVAAFTDDLCAFQNLKNAYVNGRLCSIIDVRINSVGVFVLFEGVTDRNAAELLRSAKIEIDRAKRSKPPEGKYYIDELLGAEVTVDKKPLGTLVEIRQLGAADVYVVKGKKQYSFPAVKDVFTSIDTTNKTIDLRGKRLSEIVLED